MKTTELTNEQKNNVLNFIEQELHEVKEIKDDNVLLNFNSYEFNIWLFIVRARELKNSILINLPYFGKFLDKNKFE